MTSGAQGELESREASSDPGLQPGDEAQDADEQWFAAHTRPRCEKKLADYCLRMGLQPTLPLYRSVKKYRGKTLVFHKPLFPGYLFVRLSRNTRGRVLQSDYVANLLDIPDQAEFVGQLETILEALESEYEVRLAPTIVPGTRVRIRSGPLRGLEGYVESRRGQVEVHLRLEFISQAAAVRIEADLLEPV